MGLYINTYVEVKKNGIWEEFKEPVFKGDNNDNHTAPWPSKWGRLAEVLGFGRHKVDGKMSHVYPENGWPKDCHFMRIPNDSSGAYKYYSGEPMDDDIKGTQYAYLFGDGNYSYHNCLTVSELYAVDFDEKRTADYSKEPVSLREYLDVPFFTDLEILKSLGAPDEVRVLYYFD